MSKSKKQFFKFLTMKEITEKLPGLEKKWDTKKATHANQKEVENMFKKLKVILQRKPITQSDSILAVKAELDAHMFFKQLEYYISQDEITYDQIILNTQPSDALKVFIEHADKFDHKNYWINLKNAYIIQNYKKIPFAVLKGLFSANRSHREYLMSKEDINYLKKLPKEVTIYRGGSITECKTKKYGVSWTLNKTIANKFADVKRLRDKKEMIVIKTVIKKTEIVAYISDRQEEEIIYLG